jgi:hypothetical protein
VKILTLLASGGANGMMWYNLRDEGTSFYGLLTADNTPKQGYQAYRLCASVLPGKTYYPTFYFTDMVLPTSVSAYYFSGENKYVSEYGNRALVIWNNKVTGANTVRFKLPGTEHREWDVHTGTYKALDPEVKNEWTLEPNPSNTDAGTMDLGYQSLLFITWSE